jgi:hypothetical protein
MSPRTDVTNAQTVEYSATPTVGQLVGPDIGNLTLVHTAPLGLTSVINLEMSGAGPGDLTLDTLAVGPGLASLNIISTGAAVDNVITNLSAAGVATVQDSITVTGGAHLTLGSAAGPYLYRGGVIDAGVDTGGVAAWLGFVGLNAGNPAQTFIGGTGNDFADVFNFGGDVVDFSKGGADTVQFNNATNPGTVAPLADNVPGGYFYNHVLGFTGTDSVNVDVANVNGTLIYRGAPSPLSTTQGVPVAAGDPTNPLVYTTGTRVDAQGAASNFIDIITPVNTGGLNAEQGFAAAMGDGAIFTRPLIQYSVMGSFYDATHQQAVYFVDINAAGFMQDTDEIQVVGLVHMTDATYLSNTKGFVNFV